MDANAAELRVALVATVAVAGFILWRGLVRWFRRPASPDPWGPEITEALKSPESTPICPHCQTPHEHARWFCSDCGRAVGDYNNWNPYLYLFSIGEVLREGTSGPIRKSWLTVVGYLILSLAEYLIFAPLYWYFLFRNLARKPAPTEPSGPAARPRD
jgi:hypothetical protein